jgi:hypothetical protein
MPHTRSKRRLLHDIAKGTNDDLRDEALVTTLNHLLMSDHPIYQPNKRISLASRDVTRGLEEYAHRNGTHGTTIVAYATFVCENIGLTNEFRYLVRNPPFDGEPRALAIARAGGKVTLAQLKDDPCLVRLARRQPKEDLVMLLYEAICDDAHEVVEFMLTDKDLNLTTLELNYALINFAIVNSIRCVPVLLECGASDLRETVLTALLYAIDDANIRNDFRHVNPATLLQRLINPDHEQSEVVASIGRALIFNFIDLSEVKALLDPDTARILMRAMQEIWLTNEIWIDDRLNEMLAHTHAVSDEIALITEL